MNCRHLLRLVLVPSLLFSVCVFSRADVGATGEITRVPGVAGGRLCYQVGAAQTAPDAAHFWLKLCNKGTTDAIIVVCAMLNLKNGKEETDDAFKIRKNQRRPGMPWECLRVPDDTKRRPNAHLGCKLVTIPTGGKFKDVFNEVVKFKDKFQEKDLALVYFDILFGCIVDDKGDPMRGTVPCKNVRGKNKFLTPEEPKKHADWTNIWAGTGGYLELTPTPTPTPTETPRPTPTPSPTPTPIPSGTPRPSSTTSRAHQSASPSFSHGSWRQALRSPGILVAEKDWPSGNWVTMDKDNNDFFPSRLKGTVSGAAAGSVIDFHFGDARGGHYVVPADPFHPPCGGADVPVEELFVLVPPSVAMTHDGIRIQLPSGQCGTLPEGAVTQFHAVVTAERGAPIYDPGEFMYGIDLLLVRDTVPPVIEAVDVEPIFNFLRIRAKATDVTTRALGATLVTGDGGSETQTPLNFANPPSHRDSTLFFDMVGPLPAGVRLPYRIDFFDEVSNRASTEPAAIRLDTPPAVPGLACVLLLEQQTVQARLPAGASNSLLAKLDAAAGRAASGNSRAAIHLVQAYRHELGALDRQIEDDVVAALDDGAQACIAELMR